MIGAKIGSIKKAEDRDLFKRAMRRIGLDLPRSGYARDMRDALRIQKRLNFPVSFAPHELWGAAAETLPTVRTNSKKWFKRG
jgi:carbamoyl-phosphate synthase large subunit